MIVISDDLVLAAPAGVDLNAPVIGWRNSLTANNVSNENSSVNFPVTNLANPSTYLKWKATTAALQHITVSLGAPTQIDYVAVAGHNFGTGNVRASVEGAATLDTQQKSLLHLFGADASTAVTESGAGSSLSASPHAWTASGNAQLDTAQSKFGGASLLCDGTGDWVTTSEHADFAPTGDFTVDFWFNCTELTGNFSFACGQGDSTPSNASTSLRIGRTTANVMHAVVCVGSTAFTVSGTTQFTNLVNTGFHHCALVRIGNVLRLFIDGAQEGGDVAITGVVNDSANNFRVGAAGEYTTDPWTGWIDEFRFSFGARWITTFTPPTAAYLSDQFTKILLHFNGADATTVVEDSAARLWTAVNGAQIDTAQARLGGTSLLLDGVNDYVSAPGHEDFAVGSADFTVDFWFNTQLTGGSFNFIFGQGDAGGSENANTSMVIYRSNVNVITATIRHSGGSLSCVGTTQFTNLLNTGWHHLAFVRTGGVLKLFIDGIQEGASVAAAVTVNRSAFNWAIGRWGDFNGGYYMGWIDEFRFINGRAAWSANFVPESFEYDAFDWESLGDEQLPADDQPIIWRFEETTLVAVRLRMLPTATPPEIAVMYTDTLLKFQRRIYVGHRVLQYNRRSNVVTGFSDEANFLGRLVLGELNESALDLKNITPSFYRSDMEPWLHNSVQKPFFFAWRPTSYPLEVGFCWLTNDPQMSNQRVNGMVQVSAGLRGIVQ